MGFREPQHPFAQVTVPRFLEQTARIAEFMASLNQKEMEAVLKASPKLSQEARIQWQAIAKGEADSAPVLDLYQGSAFRALSASTLSAAARSRAALGLQFASTAYGLLRATDLVSPYRLNGSMSIPALKTPNVFAFWRKQITDVLIADVEASGGELCYLGSAEIKKMFDWARVEAAVRVVMPIFEERDRSGRLRQLASASKIARGKMARILLEEGVDRLKSIEEYAPEGYITSFIKGKKD